MTLAALGGVFASALPQPASQDSELVHQALKASRPAGPRARSAASSVPRHFKQAGKQVDVHTRAPAGRHFPDNPKPSDHVLFLHGGEGSASRWVCLRRLQPVAEQVHVEGVRNLPSMKVRLPVLLEYIDSLADEPNLYLAQADFFWGEKGDKHRHRARSKYLQSIGTVFVDLDVYNAKHWDGVDIEVVAREVRRVCAQAGVPEPVIIGSGRGLYANWKLSERIDLRDPEQWARWERLQRQMMALLHDFGPDPKVRDATRILRLIGSINPRSGTRVSVLHDDGAIYTLERLEHAASGLSDTLYASSAQKAPQRPAKSKKSSTGSPSPKPCSAAREAALAQEPLSDPEAIEFLKGMLVEDERIVPTLSHTRRYQYRLFRDIAQIIIDRGGIAYGARDEFVFWLLVMRFNAGLYGADELQGLANRFAGLTQGGFNLWDAGMLGTLHARIQAQVQEHGEPIIINPVIRRKGAFAAVRHQTSRAAHRGAGSGVAPLGHGAGYARPLVYTPKASTLIERLGITPEEQRRLDCLISPQERVRRTKANSATTRRMQRNERLANQLLSGKRPVPAIARRHNVSVATAYRILGQQPEAAQQALQREQVLTNQRRGALALLKADPALSMRAVAKQMGVAVSTVHRWVKASRQSAEQAASLAKAKRVDQAIRKIALQGKKRFKRSTSAPSVSTLSASPISEIQAVPYSQSNADSNKGRAYVGERGKAKDEILEQGQTIHSLGEKRSFGRFDFVARARRREQGKAMASASHLRNVGLAPEQAQTQAQPLAAHDYWQSAQRLEDHAKLLDMWIPVIPGMQDNEDFLLDVMALYAATSEAAIANDLPESDLQTLRTAFELMLLSLQEIDDPALLDRAQELFETETGQEMMQEAYESLSAIVARHT